MRTNMNPQNQYNIHYFVCQDCKVHTKDVLLPDKQDHIGMARNHSKEFNHECSVYQDNGHPDPIEIFPK